MTLQTVEVALGERRYDILIGEDILSGASDALLNVIGKGQAAVVADAAVAALYGQALKGAIGDVPMIEVPSGEASKCWTQFERVTEALLAAKVGRDGTVIALGGGVVGDLAGYCAASLRRGCQFVQIPTTLLAQVDSSVGGKVAINAKAGKNLVGAFHQPKLVVADTKTLSTLTDRELRAGYAEVVKYGLLGDTAFFSWLEENGEDVLARDQAALAHAIKVSCAHKAKVVAQDEREGGVRALLNLGHTFGHALEAEAKYDGRLLHGEGVAIGMAMAFRYSAVLGLCSADDVARVEAHLKACDMPTHLSEIPDFSSSVERQLDLMGQDKKAIGGKIRLILVRGIGKAFLTDADTDSLAAFLKDELAAVS